MKTFVRVDFYQKNYTRVIQYFLDDWLFERDIT